MKLGPMLKKARKAAGLTQEEMGFELHLSRTNISKIERDLVEIKGSDLIRWFQASNAPEYVAAILCGADLSTLMDLLASATQLIGGFIKWF